MGSPPPPQEDLTGILYCTIHVSHMPMSKLFPHQKKKNLKEKNQTGPYYAQTHTTDEKGCRVQEVTKSL